VVLISLCPSNVMIYIGAEIDRIVEDAKYTGGIVLTYPDESILPYLQSYEPSGGEMYSIFIP